MYIYGTPVPSPSHMTSPCWHCSCGQEASRVTCVICYDSHNLFFTMKLVALGVAVVLLLTCNGFGGHAAPHVTSLYKSAGEAPAVQQRPVGDIWKDCSKASDKLKIVSMSVSPDPPKRGDTLDIKANVTFSEKVTSGKIKVNLVINKFPFISSDIDFCSTVSQFGLKCPISAGPQSFSLTVQIPDEAPTGNYTGNQYLYDQNNNELACVTLTFKL